MAGTLSGKRAFVTGGAGYIGSHVVHALVEAGCEVLVYDSLVTGHADAVPRGELVVADLADATRLRAELARFRPDLVLHFAAFIEVEESVRLPLKYYRNNLANTLNLLEAMRDEGPGLLVFSSTATVYGMPDEWPFREDMPLAPFNPYGRAKAFVEQILAEHAASADFRYASLRYFNVAGAGGGGRLGQRGVNATHLVKRAALAAVGKLPGLEIFGTDYPTPDGTCLRDYIHVEDLADAHLAAGAYLLDGGAADWFNLGYGHGTSVREVIASVRRVTGADFPVTEAPRRPGDVPVIVADASKARRVFGWVPARDDLDGIVESAWRWERKLAGLA